MLVSLSLVLTAYSKDALGSNKIIGIFAGGSAHKKTPAMNFVVMVGAAIVFNICLRRPKGLSPFGIPNWGA